jgi:ribosome maturation factor RimP
MIEKSTIEKLALEAIQGTDAFLVEVSVGAGNKITIDADTPGGITIEQCAKISRYIESKLDREKEDFSLTVSSPGMGRPLRVEKQFLKYLGRKVEVLTTDGKKTEGVLKAYTGTTLELETTNFERPAPKKPKQKVIKLLNLPLNHIKETKLIITFK